MSFASGSQLNSIGNYAFKQCTGANFNVANLPEGLETVGDLAFQQCSRLGTVTIPSSVKIIKKQAFANCNITSLTFTSGGTSALSIGQLAFDRSIVTNNVSLILPERVTSVGKKAFSGCTRLISVTLPSTLTTIDQDAFQNLNANADIYYNGTENDLSNKCAPSSTSGISNIKNVFGYDIAGVDPNNYIYHFKCGDYVWYSLEYITAGAYLQVNILKELIYIKMKLRHSEQL